MTCEHEASPDAPAPPFYKTVISYSPDPERKVNVCARGNNALLKELAKDVRLHHARECVATLARAARKRLDAVTCKLQECQRPGCRSAPGKGLRVQRAQ